MASKEKSIDRVYCLARSGRIGASTLLAVDDGVASYEKSVFCKPRFGRGAPVAGDEGTCGTIQLMNFGLNVILAGISSPASRSTLESETVEMIHETIILMGFF